MIFNGEMVRAILDGRKTQTRRVMKTQPEPSKTREGDYWFPSKKLECMVHVSDIVPGNSPIADCHLFFQEHCCPFGAAGDRIWVREAWRVARKHNSTRPADLPFDKGLSIAYASGGIMCRDEVDGPYVSHPEQDLWSADWMGKGRPSIHMPRQASRILLEITDVRVERLNGMSEEDARAEGCNGGHDSIPGYMYSATPHEHFHHLWASIYGEESWLGNPWVWVIEFKRIEGNCHATN